MSNDTFVTEDDETSNNKPAAGASAQGNTDENRYDRNDRDRDQRSRDRTRSRDRDDDVVVDDGAFTFADLAQRSSRPSMGGLSDASIAVLMEAFTAATEYDQPTVPDAVKRKRFKAVPLDSNTTGSIPALVVALPVTVLNEKMILAYVLLFEQPGPLQFKPQEERRGEGYDRLILPEDYYNKKYRELICEHIDHLSPGAKVKFVNHQVVLADTMASLNKDDSKEIINRIFDNALDAIPGYLDTMLDVSGAAAAQYRINPKMLGRGRLETTFDYSGNYVTDSSGIPLRSDILAALYVSTNANDDDTTPQRIHLGDVRSGVDLMLAADAGNERSRGWGRNRNRRDRDDRREETEPFFDLALNISAITAGPKIPYSLGLVQLLITQFALVTNSYRWANALKPRTHIAGDLKPVVELGALNLLNPDTEKAGFIDDLTHNTDDEVVEDILSDMIHSDPAIGMTITSAGEKSWVTAIYEDIALTEDVKLQKALIKTLFDDADIVFGGHFYDAWDSVGGTSSDLPVEATGAKGFVGYWVDRETSVKRPITEWNVPAVVSANKKNPTIAYDYQLTFDDLKRSVDYNLADRYAILQRTVPGLRPTGTSWQLVLSKKYIRALAIAAEKSGMAPYVTATDTVGARRYVGNDLYRRQAGSDLGEQRRGRSDRDDRDTRRGYTGRSDRSSY